MDNPGHVKLCCGGWIPAVNSNKDSPYAACVLFTSASLHLHALHLQLSCCYDRNALITASEAGVWSSSRLCRYDLRRTRATACGGCRGLRAA